MSPSPEELALHCHKLKVCIASVLRVLAASQGVSVWWTEALLRLQKPFSAGSFLVSLPGLDSSSRAGLGQRVGSRRQLSSCSVSGAPWAPATPALSCVLPEDGADAGATKVRHSQLPPAPGLFTSQQPLIQTPGALVCAQAFTRTHTRARPSSQLPEDMLASWGTPGSAVLAIPSWMSLRGWSSFSLRWWFPPGEWYSFPGDPGPCLEPFLALAPGRGCCGHRVSGQKPGCCPTTYNVQDGSLTR